MDKIELSIVDIQPILPKKENYALVLEGIKANIKLPIMIGKTEAESIATGWKKHISKRPITHDLLKTFLEMSSIEIDEIIIHNFKDGVFFAQIFGVSNNENFIIDSRPSDAIAIALRFDAPIFTTHNILNEAGIREIPISENNDEIKNPSSEFIDIHKLPEFGKGKSIVIGPIFGKGGNTKDLPDNDKFRNTYAKFSKSKLNELLEKSIAQEDYEKAAKIRDELNRR